MNRVSDRCLPSNRAGSLASSLGRGSRSNQDVLLLNPKPPSHINLFYSSPLFESLWIALYLAALAALSAEH